MPEASALERRGPAPDEIVGEPYSLLRRRGPWKDALRRRMLACADCVAFTAGAVAAGLLSGEASISWTALVFLPLWILLAKGRGLYARDHVRIGHSTLDELGSLVEWVTLSTALTALGLALLEPEQLTPEAALAFGIVGFAGVVTARALARLLWRRFVPAERTVVLGEGPLADAVGRKLALENGHHLVLGQRLALAPAGLAAVEQAIADRTAERVIVAASDLDEETLVRVNAVCRAAGVKLSLVPPLRALFGTATDLHHLAELPLVEFRTWDASRSTGLIRRAIDLAGSSAALVLLLPFLVLIAAAIKLDSRGPVLFTQRRVGQGGRPFTMFKFRTMVPDAEQRLEQVVSVDQLSEPMFKLRSDPRVTRVGRLLRRFSLDELPQLVNVLKGEMSLVGPRPEETWLVDRYGDDDRFRLEVRPGMTGPMQVHGRGELTFAERLAVEREYIENYSLRKDVKILLRTFAAVFRGRGAF